MAEWSCHVCGSEVSWGTAVCPLCGSALEWVEGDEEDHLAEVMPFGWEQEEEHAFRQRRARNYAIAAIAVGVLMATIGVISGFLVWAWAVPGMLLVAAGIYWLVTARDQFNQL